MGNINVQAPTSVQAQLPFKAAAPAVKAQPSPSPSAVHIAPDAVRLSAAPKGSVSTDQLKLYDEPAPKSASKDKDGPWQVRSVSVNAGYIAHHNIMHTGPMHIKNDAYGTDVKISGIKQVPRYNWEYITPGSGSRFAPDEPQNVLGVNVEFNNKFGFEVEAKHNKVIVGDYGQMVHFDGMINGEYVNEDRPLNTFMQQHEQTYANEQISLMATRRIDLPAPENHRFSYIVKAGPSLIATTTRTTVLNGADFDHTTSGFAVAGWGATVENGLRYELGPKLGRVGVEVAYAVSYLDYAKYSVVGGGTGSHDAVAGQFTLKLSKAFDLRKKDK